MIILKCIIFLLNEICVFSFFVRVDFFILFFDLIWRSFLEIGRSLSICRLVVIDFVDGVIGVSLV